MATTSRLRQQMLNQMILEDGWNYFVLEVLLRMVDYEARGKH